MYFLYRVTLFIGILFLHFTATSQIITINMGNEVTMIYDEEKTLNTSKISGSFNITNGTGDYYFDITWKIKIKNIKLDKYEDIVRSVKISPDVFEKSFEINLPGKIDKCFIPKSEKVVKTHRSIIDSKEIFNSFNNQINSVQLTVDLYKKRDRLNEINNQIENKKNTLISSHYNGLKNRVKDILNDLNDKISYKEQQEEEARRKKEKQVLITYDSLIKKINKAASIGIQFDLIEKTEEFLKQKQNERLISKKTLNVKQDELNNKKAELLKKEQIKIRDAFDNKINKALTGKSSYDDQRKIILDAYKDVRKNFGIYLFKDSVYYNKEYSSQLEKINKKEKVEEENSIITVNNLIAKINDTKKYGIQKEILQNATDSLNLFCKQNKIKETNCNNLNQTIQQKLVNITEMIRRVEKEEIQISPIVSSRINPNFSGKLVFSVENEYLISQSKSCVWKLKKGNPRKIKFRQQRNNLVIEKFDAFRYVFELTIYYDNINSKSKEIEIIGDFSTKNTH
jgi:hypothetical protein